MERGAQKLSGEMEVEVMEDDLLFAELSRQISLLITDDDEELRAAVQYPPSSPAVPGFWSAHVPHAAAMPPTYTAHPHAASYSRGGCVRSWGHCGSKGTGVFIPRSSPAPAHARRKGKPKAPSPAATATSAAANSRQRPQQAGMSAAAAAAQRR